LDELFLTIYLSLCAFYSGNYNRCQIVEISHNINSFLLFGGSIIPSSKQEVGFILVKKISKVLFEDMTF